MLANDNAGAGETQSLQVTHVSSPSKGSAVRITSGTSAGKVRYVPDADQFGADSFTYQVCDNGVPVACATTTVDVSITPVNDAPRAWLDLGVTREDTAVDLDVLGNDSAGPGEGAQHLTITSVTGVHSGATQVVAGKIRYTPAPDSWGLDGFTYSVCDDGVPSKCDQALVVVLVTPTNDAPTIANVTDKTTKKNKAVSFSITVGDVDDGSSSLDVVGSSSNTALVSNAQHRRLRIGHAPRAP